MDVFSWAIEYVVWLFVASIAASVQFATAVFVPSVCIFSWIIFACLQARFVPSKIPFMRDTKNMKYPWLPYFLADIVSIVLSYYLTIFIRFRSNAGILIYDRLAVILDEEPAKLAGHSLEGFYYESAFRIIFILTAVICLLYALRHLYAGRRFLLGYPVAWNVLVCNTIALAVFYGYWYLTRNTFHPRSLFATLIVLNVLFCVSFRAIMRHGLALARKRTGFDRCGAVLVGAGPAVALLKEILDEVEPQGVYVRAVMGGAGTEPFADWLAKIRETVLSSSSDMLIVVDRHLVVPQIMQIIELGGELGVPVKIFSDHLSVLFREAGLPCDVLQGTPLVHFNRPATWGGVMRRGLTLLVATTLLILSAPLQLLLFVLIRVSSPGPALFKQKRIGINRRPFYIYKFRTMRLMAESELARIESGNESKGALFKMRRDPRITPIGRFLRRFSLDELPQLFNVVRGDMALVGPRPLPERDFKRYEDDWHYIRHGGLPGLTCLWQISGRSNLNFHQMCILDIYYLRNHTWVMDVSIAFQTVRSVAFGVGAY
jgi:exopolysaccharide biosynthesis polyprenyl glycosylphosphotransferase